jgi:hypothetical protein
VRLLLVPVAAALALLAACGSDGEGGEVEVTLTEWSVTTDKELVPEGPIDFDIKNDGEREHEFLVIRTDTPPDELPTNDDGSLDEDGPDVDVEEELEDIEDGDDTSRTWGLDPGLYVLACNIVEEIDDVETSHFAEGMRTAFEVTEDED